MSICTSSPHPMVSTSYHSLAAPPSRARAGAPFGGEPGILFSPVFWQRRRRSAAADVLRATHTLLPHHSPPHDQRRGRRRAAESPNKKSHPSSSCHCAMVAPSPRRWIFYDFAKDQHKYSSQHGRKRVHEDATMPGFEGGHVGGRPGPSRSGGI